MFKTVSSKMVAQVANRRLEAVFPLAASGMSINQAERRVRTVFAS